jgi:hypothetical protein
MIAFNFAQISTNFVNGGYISQTACVRP